jgi:membrane protein implicated in regulation of membrane protease activity
MIICPWCGTQYAAFQPNCQNCGGALQPGHADASAAFEQENLPMPPPPPRSISDGYAWKLLTSDGFAIVAGVFALLGGIFSLVGIVLTIGIITAFVGIPFALIGFLFLGAGAAVLYWRYQSAQKIARVLREGQATEGHILSVEQNFAVRVNNRHPWTISYSFQANGRSYTGSITTLNPPGQQIQLQKPACVLYLPEAPETNSLYPHP